MSSIRSVPLIDVALEALQKHPTESDKIYSLHHAFEDRMKNAGLDHELRRILMGHTIDRPDYGEGGSMEWRLSEMQKLQLPYGPAIV
ncbi:hypothetical protein ACLBWZ_03350 [Brucellaceae bacterium C25G]